MEIFFTLISLFALISICLFFTAVCKVPNATSPLVAVCFTMLYFVLFGMFGMLYLGGLLYFGFAIYIVVLFVLKKIRTPKLSIYFIIFCAVSAVLIVFFGIRQPLLNSWDEFSFWGTAVKLTKINHELHTTAQIGWAWVASQKAGLIVLGYFFQFFGAYAQWKIFIALDILALAVFCALCAPFQKQKSHIISCSTNSKTDNPISEAEKYYLPKISNNTFRLNEIFLAMPMVIVLFLTPYIFTIYRELIEPSNVYMNAHSDVPMAWLFCGALAIYYTLKEMRFKLWPVALVLSALIMTRDTALPLAMVVWGIISLDLIFTKGEVSFLCIKNFFAKILHILTWLFSVLASFLGWSFYLNAITNVNSLGDLGGTQQISAVQMIISGLMQLLGIERTEHFSNILNMMIDYYFNLPLTMIGSAFWATCLVLFILTVALVFTKDKTHRFRIAIFTLFSTLGFFAYYTFIGFTFVFIFKADVSTSLIGYERYIYPYLIGWFMVSVYLVALSAIKVRENCFFINQGLIFALVLLFSYRCYQYLPVGMTFLDYHDGYLNSRKQLVETAENIVELIGENQDGTIYFISQGDNGDRWFQYTGELLPLQMDYSFGGGTLAFPGTNSGIYTYEMTAEEFCAYLTENECGYIFVERSDETFFEQFGFLFSDKLAAVSFDSCAVYRIEQTGESLIFELMGEVAR